MTFLSLILVYLSCETKDILLHNHNTIITQLKIITEDIIYYIVYSQIFPGFPWLFSKYALYFFSF